MRTHPESIWVAPEDISDGTGIGTFSDEQNYDDEVEYVPVAAYLELREFVERVANSAFADELATEARDLIAKVTQ